MKKIIFTLTLILLLTGCSINLPFSGTVTKENAVAKIVYDGETIYFDNFADAWTFVNTNVDKDIEMTFLADWVAEDGVFGKGTGFGETGNLTPIDRKKDSIKVTIDLNGFVLNRNLSEPVKSGNVMAIRKDGIYTIKNGTVTGGNTSDRGGAFWLDNNETTVYLKDLTITNNFADGNGGAIFVKCCGLSLHIDNTTITDNKTNNYGGAMYVAEGEQDIYLLGKVIIQNNTGKDNRNNITLQKTYWASKDPFHNYRAVLKDCTLLADGSIVYVAHSNFSADQTVAYNGNENLVQYFQSDAPNLTFRYHKMETGANYIETINK